MSGFVSVVGWTSIVTMFVCTPYLYWHWYICGFCNPPTSRGDFSDPQVSRDEARSGVNIRDSLIRQQALVAAAVGVVPGWIMFVSAQGALWDRAFAALLAAAILPLWHHVIATFTWHSSIRRVATSS